MKKGKKGPKKRGRIHFPSLENVSGPFFSENVSGPFFFFFAGPFFPRAPNLTIPPCSDSLDGHLTGKNLCARHIAATLNLIQALALVKGKLT
jgi:hypothetical protein